ncbi:MAG: hypothetical protein CMM61_07930, partial [Rhodospirillaceae bacterium]|nr:hypothetical protein [Rhodospirillaceae bacterium]
MAAPTNGIRPQRGVLAHPGHTGHPRRLRARALSCALAVTLSVAVGGCTYLQDLFSKEDPPLPGTRISILSNQRTLAADPELAGHQILLPAPS